MTAGEWPPRVPVLLPEGGGAMSHVSDSFHVGVDRPRPLNACGHLSALRTVVSGCEKPLTRLCGAVATTEFWQ